MAATNSWQATLGLRRAGRWAILVAAGGGAALVQCQPPDAPPPRGGERVAQTTSSLTAAVTYSQVSAGQGHACAIRSTDKRIDCWGQNDQLQAQPPLDQFTSVSAGFQRTCGLRVDGSLACWGRGAQPNVPTGTGFTYVGTGVNHACSLASDGTPSCWFAAVAGLADEGQATVPVGKKFTSISVGNLHNCGLVTDGTVTCWGRNAEGQSTAPAGNFKAAFAGGAFSCAQRADSSITCWGSNEAREVQPTPPQILSGVSLGTKHGCGVSGTAVVCWGDNTAGQVNVPPGAYSQVAASGDLTCALKTDGSLACWGSGRMAQAITPTPRTAIAVRASLHHACALESDGTPYCWGSPTDKALYTPILGAYTSFFGGYDHAADRGQVPQGQLFADIVTGLDHTCGLKFDRSVACWGSNAYGQLNVPPGARYTQIASRGHHTCGLKSTGKIECWGLNAAPFPPALVPVVNVSTDYCYNYLPICAPNTQCLAQICDYDPQSPSYPRSSYLSTFPGGYAAAQAVVPASLASTTFTAVATGPYNTCGRKTDGTWACWGDGVDAARFLTGAGASCNSGAISGKCNWNGESDVPPGSPSLTSVSVRHGFAAGLKTDGTPYFWGSNFTGQFDAPVGVKFTEITAGGGHGCGLQANGTAACWGTGGNNQLFVPPGVAFSQVRAGENNTCGVAASGEALCWGANDSRQSTPPPGAFAGLSVRLTRPELDRDLCVLSKNGWPSCQFGSQQKPFPTRLKAFGAGQAHECGLAIDATITCTGDNSLRQRDLPVNPSLPAFPLTPPVPAEATVTDLSVGANHTCILALNPDGATFGDGYLAYCWGDLSPGASFVSFPQPLISIAASGGRQACGVVAADKSISCVGPDNLGDQKPPRGAFKRVRGGYGNFCAIRTDDTVVCWGQPASGMNVTPPAAFKDVAVGVGNACGLKMDDTVLCWGNPAESPAGKFRSITAGSGFTCGERMDGMLACWGMIIAGTRDGLAINQTTATVTACQDTTVNLTASSGTPPLTFSILSDGGQLPPGLTGLTLSPAGVLSGHTPLGTAGGTYTMTLAVTDLFGYRGIGTLAVTVSAGVPATVTPLGGATPQSAVAGAAFASPLSLVVKDCAGNPLAGLPVTYLAGTNGGATAILSAQSAQTNASGTASVTASASAVAGAYSVHATTYGLTAEFLLANVKDLKSSCSRNEECQSGSCADGVCCDSACTGTCQSCDGTFNTKGTGTCSPVQEGIDPRSQCGKATCAQDSVVKSACNGQGSCQASSESCSPYTCDGKTRSCKSRCQADGDCAAGGACDPTRGQCVGGVVTGTCNDATSLTTSGGQTVSCAPYQCSHGGCRSECVTSNDCATGNECRGQKCQPTAGTDDGGADANVTINAKRGCSVGASGGAALEGWAGLSLALGMLQRARRKRRAPGRVVGDRRGL